MNVRNKYSGKIAIYISVIFCLLFLAALAQAQPRPLTQKEMDKLNAALEKIQADGDVVLKKAPTPAQDVEFSSIAERHQRKYAKEIFPDSTKFGAEIEKTLAASDCPLTRSHIQNATLIHKKMRSLYAEHFKEISDWGNKTGRAICVRQAGKVRAYMIKLSDQWLAQASALPLATVADRAYAAYWLGGGVWFSPGGDPLADHKHDVGFEIIRLYGVCRGNNEYEPGAE